MQGSSDSPRTSDIPSSGGPSHTPSLALSPAQSQQDLPVGEGLFPSSPIIDRVSSGSAMDRLFGISPLCPRFGLLSSKTARWRCRWTLRTRAGASTSKERCFRVSGCGCPSPYHLPGGLPSPVRRPPLPPLAEGQLDVHGVHPTRRWHSISSSSSPGTQDPSRSSAQDLDTSGIRFYGGKSPSGRSVSIPDAAGLVSPDQDLSPIGSTIYSPGNRPFRDNGVGAHTSLLRLGRRSRSGGSGYTRSAMELSPGVRVSSSPNGIFLLVTPFWPAQKWFPAVLDLQVMDVHRLPEVIDLTSGLSRIFLYSFGGLLEA